VMARTLLRVLLERRRVRMLNIFVPDLIESEERLRRG
jgi:hypothetical protein